MELGDFLEIIKKGYKTVFVLFSNTYFIFDRYLFKLAFTWSRGYGERKQIFDLFILFPSSFSIDNKYFTKSTPKFIHMAQNKTKHPPNK